jgi:[acyl-carrier-protein] S-malonyltransferase
MNSATKIMTEELNKLNFENSTNKLISNVTADEINNIDDLKNLLIKFV